MPKEILRLPGAMGGARNEYCRDFMYEGMLQIRVCAKVACPDHSQYCAYISRQLLK